MCITSRVHHEFLHIYWLMLRVPSSLLFFFFNDTATTEIYTLSLHDALPIFLGDVVPRLVGERLYAGGPCAPRLARSEEHTSELQSRSDLVCRLLLEKKKNSDQVFCLLQR